MITRRWYPIILSSLIVFSGCSWFNNNDSSSSSFTGTRIDNCQGNPTFIIVDGECVPVGEILPENIHVDTDGTIDIYNQSIETFDEFVADLSGSVGLAVVPEDYYESTKQTARKRTDLAQWADLDTTIETQNVIVKLTEEGFFEEVDFVDGSGAMVDVTANPLALEVFGDFTLVVFEVNTSNPTTEFVQKVNQAFYSGGVYVIHNPSGKMFATRDVTYIENTYTYTQNLSRNVTINVTVGEPVIETQMVQRVDEFGQPVYNEFNQPIMDEVPFPLTDSNGDPLIITEGPFVTEWVTEPKVEYFMVPRVDEEGEPVIDPVTGLQYKDIVEQPVTDANGDPVMVSHEVVVMDNEWNPVRQTTFDMNFHIEELKEITHTTYNTVLADNALTPLAQKFVDRLMSKYYNWYYTSSRNYVISNWGFAMGEQDIYFMQQVNNAQNQPEQIVKKLGFDDVTNELTIENYLNITKAGLEGAEIILDPITSNIFALFHTNNVNLKVYSPTEGLYTLPNSSEFSAVTFPNGDLYFHKNRMDFVEELGYSTIILYQLNSEGDLVSKPIKLASYQMKANMASNDSVGVYLYDEQGTKYTTMMDWIPIANDIGDPLLSTAELHYESVEPFSAERIAYNWYNASYQVTFHILDREGVELTKFDNYIMIDEGDPIPPYDIYYQLDSTVLYNAKYEPSTNIRTCTNVEYGCVNHYYLMDPTVAEYGINLYENRTIAYQASYIQSINVHPENNGVYSYSRVITSDTCDFETCDEQVRYDYYDLAGELLQSQYGNYHAILGEDIPLVVEYRMSASTTLETEPVVCNSSTGCWRNYMTTEGTYYSIFYEAGDTVYSNIQFAPGDRTLIMSRTVESTVCTEPNGCNAPLSTKYTIRNPENEVLYEFEQSLWVNYGYRVPLDVTLTYDADGPSDVEIIYQLDYSSEQMFCLEEPCEDQVSIQLPKLTAYNYQPYGYVEWMYGLGDPLWQSIILPDAMTPIQTNSLNSCKDTHGCTLYTSLYSIIDDADNVVEINTSYHPNLQVRFDYGDLLPTGDFTANFRLENIVYETNQLNPYPVLNNWGQSLVLDENMYLFPPTSPNWEGTPYVNNIVLTYDPLLDEYSVGYTNLEGFYEIVRSGEDYYTINDEKTGIYKYVFDDLLSNDGFYYFAETYLTEGLAINAANELIVDFDGTIYFRGVDNFIQDMTGVISVDGVVTIDTVYTEHEIIRLTPVN